MATRRKRNQRGAGSARKGKGSRYGDTGSEPDGGPRSDYTREAWEHDEAARERHDRRELEQDRGRHVPHERPPADRGPRQELDRVDDGPRGGGRPRAWYDDEEQGEERGGGAAKERPSVNGRQRAKRRTSGENG